MTDVQLALFGAPDVVELRPIPGFPMFSATADGRIWSCRSCRWLSQHVDRQGYHRVSLFGLAAGAQVHQLVAAAFHGPQPEGMQVRHLDGDKDNNTVGNLAYGTQHENSQDRLLHEGRLTHCLRGHEWTPENTVYRSRGPGGTDVHRSCRECRREAKRQDRKRRAGMTKSPGAWAPGDNVAIVEIA